MAIRRALMVQSTIWGASRISSKFGNSNSGHRHCEQNRILRIAGPR